MRRGVVLRSAAAACLAVACLVARVQAAPSDSSSAVADSVAAPTITWSDSLEMFVLGEVVVTGDPWREEIHARRQTLSSTDLDIHPGNSAREVLKAVPGVGVSLGRKDEASITMRGFGSRRVAIMVDGRPMNIPYYGTFNLASVSVDKLEKIVVVRGPASVTYGPNVMGGVVNFVTARGRDHPGTRLRLRGGNHETTETLLTHGLVQGPWDLLLSVRRDESDGSVLSHSFRPTGFPGTEDGYLRDNSDFAAWDLFGKLGYSRGTQTDVALSFGYHTVEKGVPSAIDEERYWRFTDWRRTFADLTLRREVSPTTFLEAKAYGDVFINTLVDYEDETYDLNAVFYNSTHHNWDVGGIVALEHDWKPGLHGTYGLNLREDQIKKRMNPEEPWLYHHNVTGSLHAEHHLRIGDDVTCSVGLADNFVIFNHLEEVDHVFGFSSGFSARLRPGWTGFVSLGQSSRFPTLSQLWSLQSGNRDLRPEITQRAEVGVDGLLFPGLQTQVTLFANQLRDLIDRDVRRAGRYYNIRSARTWGTEIGAIIAPFDWPELETFYTYTRAENRESGDPLDLIPRHKVDGRAIASSADRKTQWALILTHVGERFDSETLTSDQMLDAYTTLDCRVSTHLSDQLEVTLEIMNIGDLNYEEEVMYPAPGRTVLVGVAIDF